MSQLTPEAQAVRDDLKEFLKKGISEELDGRKLDNTLLTQTQNAIDKFRDLEEKNGVLTEEVNKLKAHNQRLIVEAEKGESFDETIHKSLVAGADQINRLLKKESTSESLQIETKAVAAMTTANNITGAGYPQTQYSSTIVAPLQRTMRMRDLFPTQTLEVGFGSLTVGVFKRKEGGIAYQTEGAAKAKIDYKVEQKNYSPQTMAGVIDVSRQMMRRVAWLGNFVQRFAIDDFLNFEDNALMNGTGVNQIEGIATIAAVYVPSGLAATNSDHWSLLVNARAQLKKARFRPNGVLADPIDAGDLLIVKTSTGEFTDPRLVLANGLKVVDVPIIETDIVSSPQFIIGDFTRSEYFIEEALTVRMSEEAGDNFSKNMISIRVEGSGLLANYYADAYLNGTFTPIV